MFLEYNIPSDLLSFSGPEDASLDTKIRAVQGHVQELNRMIAAAKSEVIPV